MKKIISYIFVLGLLFSACNPMEDINNEVDSIAITNVKKDIEVVLTDADYEEMDGEVAENLAFSTEYPATDYLPDYLVEFFPALTAGSVANITYNYMNSYPDLSEYSGLPTYTLTVDNYSSVSTTVGVAGYFSPSNPADDYIPTILASSVTDATSGDIYIVSYKYSDIDPEEKELQEVTIFEKAFIEDLGVFQAISVTGDQTWYWSSYSSDTYAKISGYSGGAKDNEDWLISPQIDLTGYSDAKVNFTQTAKFVNDQWEQLSILVSSDYNGTDPSAATWTNLTVPNLPSGSDYTFVNSGDIDISAFDGEKIYVAFKYISSTSNAATWEVMDVTVKGTITVTKSGIIADPVVMEELYTYTTKWTKTTGAYYLTTLDYDSMGETSGQPGRYNNFSSSILPENYLPQFLSIKYPYAQEGNVTVVLYKYYSTTTQVRADEYVFSNGVWGEYNPVVVKTDQYILTASAGWVFDPTVNYTMASADYQIIVDYVKTNIGAEYISSYGNNETYYGSNAFYSEFQIGSGYFNSSFATWQNAVKEAVGEGFLPNKYPGAVAQVEGIDVNYVITFAAYAGSMIDYTITFQCTKSGPSPEFTYVEGPTLVE